jgi:hypothetical protein
MSMIDNLEIIKHFGMEEFINQEKNDGRVQSAER